jgi:hypothetical protein
VRFDPSVRRFAFIRNLAECLNFPKHKSMYAVGGELGVACRGSKGSEKQRPRVSSAGVLFTLSARKTENLSTSCTPKPFLPSGGHSPFPERTLTSSKKVCLGSAAQTTSRQADAQFGKVIRSKLGKLLARRGVPGAADMIRRIARRESEGGSQFSSSLGPRKV